MTTPSDVIVFEDRSALAVQSQVVFASEGLSGKVDIEYGVVSSLADGGSVLGC